MGVPIDGHAVRELVFLGDGDGASPGYKVSLDVFAIGVLANLAVLLVAAEAYRLLWLLWLHGGHLVGSAWSTACIADRITGQLPCSISMDARILSRGTSAFAASNIRTASAVILASGTVCAAGPPRTMLHVATRATA